MSPSRIQPVKYVSVYSLEYNSSHDSPLISSIMLSAIPPPSPSVFMGRDDLVQEGIANLLADSPHSIIIMGFGGMGKTSLALRILNDAAVLAKYEAHTYFIPCDEVCSVEFTMEILLQTVIKLMQLELTSDPVKQLYTISKPTILVFDNFETLWDNSKNQHSIQRILGQLNSMKQITLVITMRGTDTPFDVVDWLKLPDNGLSSLNESISLDLFSTISGYAIDEKAAKTLIKELDGWPLAIMLMACQVKNLTPEELLRSWHIEKTSLLKKPGAQADRLSSVDISIKITLQSSILSSDPNILKLLSVICHLPNGIPTWNNVIHKMLPRVSEQTSIISILLQSGIIYKDNKGGVKLLSPIQEYLKKHFLKPDTDIKKQICLFYMDEINNNSLKYTSLEDKTKFGVLHSKNIEWISYRLLDNDISEKHLATIYDFCYFQYLIWDSDKLLRRLIFQTKQKNMQILYASALLLSSKRYLLINQHKLAQKDTYKAMQIFEVVNDSLGTAECLQSLGDILQMTNQYSEATIKLEKAMQMFEDIDHSLGAAQCLQSLGNILQMTNQYSEATIKLEKAMQMFEDIDHSLGVAECLRSLGDILQITNQYSEATIKLEKAMQMFENIDNSLGTAQCLQSLGNILRMTNQYSKATIKLEKAMQMFEDIDNSLGTAQCLRSLGDILQITNQYSKALSSWRKLCRCLKTLTTLLEQHSVCKAWEIFCEWQINIQKPLSSWRKLCRCLKTLTTLLEQQSVCKAWEIFCEWQINIQKPLSSWRKLCRYLKTLTTLLEQHSVCEAWEIFCKWQINIQKPLSSWKKLCRGLKTLTTLLEQHSVCKAWRYFANDKSIFKSHYQAGESNADVWRHWQLSWNSTVFAKLGKYFANDKSIFRSHYQAGESYADVWRHWPLSWSSTVFAKLGRYFANDRLIFKSNSEAGVYTYLNSLRNLSLFSKSEMPWLPDLLQAREIWTLWWLCYSKIGSVKGKEQVGESV